MESKDLEALKSLLKSGDGTFWQQLKTHTENARDFDEFFLLSNLRKKASARNMPGGWGASKKIKLALAGGYSLYPFYELLQHFCEIGGRPCEIWRGDFDNYISEITDEASGLYKFQPEIVLLIPSKQRCRYNGRLTDPIGGQREAVTHAVESLLQLAQVVHQKSQAEVFLTNFLLPAGFDLGAYRSRTLGSDWSFRKAVNLELGLKAPSGVQICDLEFLAYRMGGLRSHDDRAWFESKQPCSAALLVEFAREAASMVLSFRRAPKKVLALDLDNTLWGGVVAESGLAGIELGDTSPRGEAFKAFQRAILSLRTRGVLLAVCSKNNHATAMEVFEKHPEMLIKPEDVVSFKANWEPKSDNLRQMAAELNLGLDSFVFVDDNPAEIEIVRQFAPEVTTLLLGPDPSGYARQLQDCRWFEPQNITTEDAERTGQYRSEGQRQQLFSSATNMDAYLGSLDMEAIMSEFTLVDAPRLSQLINKSNQFNLTTRRRTETEIQALIANPEYIGFSVRLKDRFGDHGLISIVVGKKTDRETMVVDTWLMSCRVLKRQVEDEVLTELARLAIEKGCTHLKGIYLPTPKNEMVRDFYGQMGFTSVSENEEKHEYELALKDFQPAATKIKITRRAYESS